MTSQDDGQQDHASGLGRVLRDLVVRCLSGEQGSLEIVTISGSFEDGHRWRIEIHGTPHQVFFLREPLVYSIPSDSTVAGRLTAALLQRISKLQRPATCGSLRVTTKRRGGKRPRTEVMFQTTTDARDFFE